MVSRSNNWYLTPIITIFIQPVVYWYQFRVASDLGRISFVSHSYHVRIGSYQRLDTNEESFSINPLNLKIMGTFKQGVFGGFSGAIGNVVGGSWKGINYMRILPSKVSNPNSDRQLDQRMKFALIGKFLKPLSQFVKIGFKNYAIKMTAYNAAMAHNLHYAIDGVYPTYTISYPNVMVTCGSLPPALNQAVQSTTAGIVDFSWTDNSTEISASPLDKTMLVVYNPLKNQAVCVIDEGVRADSMQTITVPNSFRGDQVYCYIGFITPDALELSNSNYVGAITIAG